VTAARVGVDIGGTFTDFVLLDEETGELVAWKIPTRQFELGQSIVDGIQQYAKHHGTLPPMRRVIHGTTVNSNAILEHKGARCGLITTRGFRDILEIGRQTRPDLYRWHIKRPTPLIPRHLRFEVTERISAKGKVLVPVSEEELRHALVSLRNSRVEAVAVCLLNSYANPEHEQQIRAIACEMLPQAYVVTSSDLAPEFREFERFSTAAVAAYVGPVFSRYVEELIRKIDSAFKPTPSLYIMQSSGGVVGGQFAAERPHLTIESGPAAGALAAADFGKRFGQRDLLAFDMGGTTAKASLIRDGKPNVTDLLVVGADNNRPGILGARVAGLPVRAVSVDLVECSAGGGSIAWVDLAGILKVGPGSAGVSPGPVCYGGGGLEPTVTDAHAVLGHISPDALLGGHMRIDPEGARRAIQDRIAAKLGVDVHAAAQGIIDVANANMLRILRVISVARGFDPRDFALIPFGGGGPLHAGDLANELGIAQIVVPPNPGVFSAVGLVTSEIHAGFSRTVLLRAAPESLPTISHWFEQFVSQCHAALERERVPESAWRVVKFLDMRYAKQNFELEIPVNGKLESQEDLDTVIAAFHATHTQNYGHSDPAAPVEIVSVKTRASGEGPPVRFRPIATGDEDSQHAYVGSRLASMGSLASVETPRYDRSKLLAGNVLKGPAIVDSFDSTCLILPGHVATVGALGELVILTRLAANLL